MPTTYIARFATIEERNASRSRKLTGQGKSLLTRARMHASHRFPAGSPEWQEAVEEFLHRDGQRERVAAALRSGDILI